MRVVINDKEVVFPSSLSEYTLGQRIAFHQEHGVLLDQMLESILKMEDEFQKELEMVNYQLEKMFRTFAFFAGCTPEAVKEQKFIDDVSNIYYSCLAVLFDEEKNLELQRSFVWKGEQWELAEPELKNGSKMKFGEFIDAKQTVKDMSEMGAGKWEAMLPLCAIYLRKKDEPYKEEFLFEYSERMELMKELPMDMAMQVGFFLISIVNFYMNTSMSLKSQEQRELAVT